MIFNDNPDPLPNDNDSLWELLIDYSRKVYPPVREEILELMKERSDFGIKKYGTPLQLDNGRNFTKDALEEALDLMVYLYGFVATAKGIRAPEMGEFFLGRLIELIEFLYEKLED